MAKQSSRPKPLIPEYWMSYSDMMSALLLLFALFLLLLLYDYNAELRAKEQEIERLLSLRSDIILALSEAFEGSNLAVSVDPQTGAIRFDGGVFFAFDSTEVTDTGQEYLEDFVPQYVSILLSDRFVEHIAQIIVEGHTDQVGSFLYNLDLSQRRAYAVVETILSEDFIEFDGKERLRDLLTANGRSWTQPLLEDGEPDWERSRRVEFKFQLKDDELMKQIGEVLAR